MISRTRVAVLVFLACGLAAPAFSQLLPAKDDLKKMNPNTRCKLEGPDIAADPTRACYMKTIRAVSPAKAELEDRYILNSPLTAAEEPVYCFCARMNGMDAWSERFSRTAFKNKSITKDNTADLLPFARYYAQLTGFAQCHLPEAPPEARLDGWRKKYVDAIGLYISKPTDNPLIGKPSQTRTEAVQILAGLDKLGPDKCEEALANENAAVIAAAATWISTGDAKDKKK